MDNAEDRTTEIQKYLDQIVNEERADDWWITERFVKNTLDKIPKEITVIALPPELEKDNYNCFIFALGLHTNQRFLEKVKGKLFSRFFHMLIEVGAVISTQNPQKGDIIAYSNPQMYGEEFTHVGIIDTNDLVLSKWAWGPLLLHNKLHVPFDWGTTISYYRISDGADIAKLYDDLKEHNV